MRFQESRCRGAVPAPNQKRNRILSWLINLFGVLAFALILYWGGIEAWQQIVEGDWRYVLAALAVTLLWNLVAAYRWSLISVRVAGDAAACPYRYYLTYHMIGMVTGQVLPITIGMLGGRPVALSLSRGVPLGRAAVSVFLDKLFDLVLALLLVVPIAACLVGWISRPLAFALMGGIVTIATVGLAWKYGEAMRFVNRIGVRIASRLARLLAHMPLVGLKLVRLLARRLPQQLDRLTTEGTLSNRLAAQAFLLTMVLYALLSTRLIFVVEALRLDIPWALIVMGVCITQLAVVFSITPGSLGFLEGGWAAVLGLAGLSLDQFTTFVIGRRAYVLVFTVIGLLLAFAWIRESPAYLFRAVITAARQPSETQGRGGQRDAARRCRDAPPPTAQPVDSEGQSQV